MAGTGFFFDERCLWHAVGGYALLLPVGGWVQPLDGNGHPESPASKRRMKALMDVSGLSAKLDVRTAPPATEDDILRIHTRDYIRRFKAGSDADGGVAGLDAPFGRGSFEIALQSAGLAIGAVDAVLSGRLDNAYALSRPPGHHCLADSGMGFCLLANIAIAIEAAKARHGLGRVAVLDWDVHHGNGTQAAFYDRNDVLTISVHQENCFPPDQGAFAERGEGKGLGANLNIPLMPGGGSEAYAEAFRQLVVPALQRFKPDLIIVASGFDANSVDPLSRMMLSSEDFRVMARTVKAAAAELCGGRLVLVHEGGYSEAYVPFCGLAVMEEISGHRTAVDDPLRLPIAGQQPTAPFNALQRKLIGEMAEALR